MRLRPTVKTTTYVNACSLGAELEEAVADACSHLDEPPELKLETVETLVGVLENLGKPALARKLRALGVVHINVEGLE